MARKRRSNGFTALKVEGGILPPEFLQTVAAQEASKQYQADYGVSKSLVLREELARYWRIGSDLYARYSERRARKDLNKNRVGVDEWLVELIHTILGYDDLVVTDSVAIGDRIFKLTHRACGDAVPLLLVTDDFDLERADTRFGDEGRRQTPHGLIQEYLNAEDRSLWGIVANGNKLRILRNNPSLTRPAFIEADLNLIFDEELYSDFAALWLTLHASRLKSSGDNPYSCIIETWREKAHEIGVRALENLREGVTEALRQIGNGFLQHQDNADLRSNLEEGTLTTEHFFQQLLRLVYRLLFLFTVEERNLLHSPESTAKQRAVYKSGYSLSRLRERALRRRHYDRHQDSQLYAFGLDKQSRTWYIEGIIKQNPDHIGRYAMNILELFETFQTQEQCIEYLEDVRWKGEPVCLYCESKKVCRHASADRANQRWQCQDCNRAFAVTVGTIFHRTHKPLKSWFMVLALMLNAKKSVSSCQISRDLGIRQPTVWSMMHRARVAMAVDQDASELLYGIVETDDAYIGGKPKKPNKKSDHKGKRGRGTEKTCVIGAVERGGKVKAQQVTELNSTTIGEFLDRVVDKAGTMLMADQLPAYNKPVGKFDKSARIDHSQMYVDGIVHTNTIEGFWSLVKRAWYGTHHHYSVSLLPLYLSESCYKYNHRKADSLFDHFIARAVSI